MITAKIVEAALISLSNLRPVFHSEADFQHALALHFLKCHPVANARLELPFRGESNSKYLDLLLSDEDSRFAVELKYKTRAAAFDYDGESFHLKQQGAQDLGRYDFLADIERLEEFIASRGANSGCAILLTNDQSYWSAPRKDTVDAQFRLFEGRVIEGSLSWKPNTAPGTIKNRESPIELQGRYELQWDCYSNLPMAPGNEFRFLMCEAG